MRPYLTESLGAFFWVLIVLGTATVSPVLTAFVVGAVVAASVWMGAHISGAHFNPAVTLGVHLRGGLSSREMWRYCAAQLGGAVVAAVLAMVVWHPHGGGVDVTSATVLGHTMVGEFGFTFALVCVVLGTGAAARPERNVGYGLAVGCVVLIGVLSISEVSAAAFNPVVALAMSLDGSLAWHAVTVYLVAEVGAALAAAWVVSRLSRPLR